jgi:hypothetical protein
VRWSAAKGIGRICMRVQSDDGDTIVGAVLELFESVAIHSPPPHLTSRSVTMRPVSMFIHSAKENDNLWHGGCLALAELVRRGQLLPARLKEAMPIVLRVRTAPTRVGFPHTSCIASSASPRPRGTGLAV